MRRGYTDRLQIETMKGDYNMDATEKVMINKNNNEKGVTTVEYAVMLVLVAIGVMALDTGIAGSVTGVFTDIANSLTGQ